jgi:hypothetical protein
VNQPNASPASHFSGVPALAATFLLAGLGYSSPFLLFPPDFPLNGPVSSEVLNLNFLVAWTGLAHFAFAYEGQARSLLRSKQAMPAGILLAGMAATIVGLLAFRRVLGGRLFDSLVWVYFIPHFVKAERHFVGRFSPETRTGGWIEYWFPGLAFGFLTLALFGPRELSLDPWRLVVIALGICLLGLAGGAHRQLYQSGAAPAVLLGFFFVGEGLVWGSYSKYMTPQFRQGVYGFHIAVASFHHYLRAYGFAWRVAAVRPGAYWTRVAMINIGIIAAGFTVLRLNPDNPLNLVFDVNYFTFWVALHLLGSDLFSWLKLRERSHGQRSLQPAD